MLNEIIVTPHASMKAANLFGIEYGPKSRQYIVDNLKKATFVSEIVGETGKVDRLFAYRRTAFILDQNEDVVITVYIRDNVDAELRAKVRELLFDHLSELSERERELEDEILAADIELEMLGELSKAGVQEAGNWLNIAERSLVGAKERLHEFQVEKSKVAKGVVAYL